MSVDRARRRLLAAGAAAAAGALGAAALRARSADAETVIPVLAKKFEYVPSEIRLRKGEPAVLELTSDEVTMGFYAPAFGARAEIVPGRAARVRLEPQQEGTFEFHCDVFCGEGHEDMAGTIVVTA